MLEPGPFASTCEFCLSETELVAGEVSGHDVYRCRNCGKITFQPRRAGKPQLPTD